MKNIVQKVKAVVKVISSIALTIIGGLLNANVIVFNSQSFSYLLFIVSILILMNNDSQLDEVKEQVLSKLSSIESSISNPPSARTVTNEPIEPAEEPPQAPRNIDNT